MIRLILAALLLFSCNEDKKEKPKPVELLTPDQVETLQAKFDLYKELSQETLDEKGWLQDTKCDGLLFQSLYALATGLSDPYASEDNVDNGKYYRHWTKSCYSNHINDIPNGSSSETSRDMYIALFTFIIKMGDRDKFKSILSYGESNKWIMGEADSLGAVEFRPDLIAHTYQIEHYFDLGNNVNRFFNLDYSTCKDFSCHLRALLIWQRQMMGLYNKRDKDQLNTLTKIDERNAFFFALQGRFDQNKLSAQKAYELLIDDKYFPSERLPTAKEKCGFYLWEREPTSSAWEPCSERKDNTWSGVDFLIATYVLLEDSE